MRVGFSEASVSGIAKPQAAARSPTFALPGVVNGFEGVAELRF